MGFHASSCVSSETDSGRAGRFVGQTLREAFAGQSLATVIVYATVVHDQNVLLAGVRETVGPGVVVMGSSAQGVTGHGLVLEGGFGVGAMGLGGDSLRVAAAHALTVQEDGVNKGRQLASSLKQQLGQDPDLLFLLYDPLCGADVNQILSGMREEVSSPIMGGAAGQNSGPVATTYQYHQEQAFTQSAVVLGLVGPFTADFGVSHGTTPTGIVMTLTRAEGNKLLEFDGRPALDVWRETTGLQEDDLFHQDHTAALAMGIERTVINAGREEAAYLIRAVFGLDVMTKAIVVPAAIPVGSKLLFHHRTARVVKEGTMAMGKELTARLAGKVPWAVLGFECGARTAPFLGPADTLEENVALQAMVGPRSPWLTTIPWGEIATLPGNEPSFCNYTYTLVALTQ